MFRRNHKATPPASNVFVFANLTNTLDEMLPVRSSKPNEQNAVVRSGSELSQVGEVEILRTQETFIPLGSVPDFPIATAVQTFLRDRVNVVG